ncbi:sulfite exporter TauE/SafE family protein 3-like isoform X2 [Mangifera indica]|uniref:sulfite exporter TauE/SafE family protein 3-like isoform X2 n=1 Tax=Mangifera indica TaxID=29780 RepID=UPI001CF99ECE|nr:sulfite exporter TauE/SafE family protein 3-like isoform X2 [Mangifera indica]
MRLTVAFLVGLFVLSSASAEAIAQETKTSQKTRSGYKHVWPDMEFGWRIVVGSIIACLGAASGSVGGVGGGGIYVPMLALIIGFDTKSSAALSKCMITGAAGATVFYNLRQRHPTLDLPIIDYDLALLFQPMLMVGISIGVAFNVIFPDWLITVLIVILFTGLSIKAFLKGIETWKKETQSKKEATKSSELMEEFELQPESLNNTAPKEAQETKRSKSSVLDNIYWKEFGLLVGVWVIILALQIATSYTTTCSILYWILNILQLPVAGGVSIYEAVSLYKGRRRIASKGDLGTNWRVYQLVFYCACGLIAGIVAGLLGIGGGFILGPLFLEIKIPPQVSSATATFVMTFSASMCVVEYYLLKRFPIPYALYFFCVTVIAALGGQLVMKKLIVVLGRASLIIFTLSITMFATVLSLGGLGLKRTIEKIQHKEYMGFYTLCTYT